MTRPGLTLIETLAALVLLAIVASSLVPIVAGIGRDARSAAHASHAFTPCPAWMESRVRASMQAPDVSKKLRGEGIATIELPTPDRNEPPITIRARVIAQSDQTDPHALVELLADGLTHLVLVALPEPSADQPDAAPESEAAR